VKHKLKEFMTTKPTLQKYSNRSYAKKSKINTTMKMQERLSINRWIDKQRRTRQVSNYKNNKMAGITTCLWMVTLNGNGLNSPIKRHRLVDWIKK
jgi:hypothetical protein